MEYRYKILTETGKELVLTKSSEYLAKKAVAGYNKRNAREGLWAEYIGPDKPETRPINATHVERRIIRSTLTFGTPHRTSKGVEVLATFDARKSTHGKGRYQVRLVIDPNNRGLIDHDMDILNRANPSSIRSSHRAEQNTFDTRTNRELAKEVRDIFVRSVAWTEIISSR